MADGTPAVTGKRACEPRSSFLPLWTVPNPETSEGQVREAAVRTLMSSRRLLDGPRRQSKVRDQGLELGRSGVTSPGSQTALSRLVPDP
jgi:hypothetical protein